MQVTAAAAGSPLLLRIRSPSIDNPCAFHMLGMKHRFPCISRITDPAHRRRRQPPPHRPRPQPPHAMARPPKAPNWPIAGARSRCGQGSWATARGRGRRGAGSAGLPGRRSGLAVAGRLGRGSFSELERIPTREELGGSVTARRRGSRPTRPGRRTTVRLGKYSESGSETTRNRSPARHPARRPTPKGHRTRLGKDSDTNAHGVGRARPSTG